MKDSEKTKEQLLEEIEVLKKKLAVLAGLEMGIEPSKLAPQRELTEEEYAKQRAYVRAKAREEGINVRIVGKDFDRLSKARDISEGGILLKTVHKFNPGDELILSIYLPIFARPVEVAAKAVRVKELPDTDPAEHEVNIQFLHVDSSLKKKLKETVHVLTNPKF